ncbi:MAG: ROK family protein [Solobacterium sp.]|nr:ROK family protein [Solobacterium sp.]
MENDRSIAQEFVEWIKKRNHDNYELEESTDDTDIVLKMETPYASGSVIVHFLEYTIAELSIVNKKEENVFYLHFELKNLDHAKDLFLEMEECLLKQWDVHTRKVLFCCTCGLTTSFFAMRMNEVSKMIGVDMEFTAVPYENLFENIQDKDAILLAPQMSYRLKNVQEIITDKIVMKIPTPIFSSYDAPGMILLLKEKFDEQDKEKRIAAKQREKLLAGDGAVLVVSVIYMEGRNQIAYRLYNKDKIAIETQITKTTYRLSDIYDVIDTVKLLNPDLYRICIVTPGAIHEGKLTYENVGIQDEDIVAKIHEGFDGDVFLYNDTDMITLGYAMKNNITENCAFYFVPTGNYAGNIGIVVNGQLLHGTGHMGGRQLDAVTNITTFPQNPYALQRTPEGNVELAARYITGLFSYTGITHIAFYSKMIADANRLIEKVKEFLPEQYLPTIVKEYSVREYLYAGALYQMHQDMALKNEGE